MSKPNLITPLAAKRLKEGHLVDGAPYQGLRLVCGAKSKSWIYRYKDAAGRMKQMKLGSYPAMTLSRARVEVMEAKEKVAAGIDPRAAKQDVAATPFTVASMVEHYLVERIAVDRKPKGAKEVRRLLEHDLAPIATLLVADVTAEQLHTLILAIKGRAPDTARYFRRELRCAWDYALACGRTEALNPITRMTGGKLTQGRRDRVLSEAEVATLLRWMGNYSHTVQDALRLMLYTGLRSGEVVGISADEIKEEADGQWLTIPAERMKAGKSHRVPLTGTALEIVSRRMEGATPFLFPAKVGGPVKQKVLGVEVYSHSGRSKARVYRGRAVCPVRDWVVHDLRRTTRTMLAQLGCPFEAGEAILAHTLPGVAGIYNRHSFDAEKRKWLTALGSHLDALSVENVVSIHRV